MPCVELLYFGWLRERLDRGAESLSLPAEIGTVGDVLAWLAARDGDPDGPFACAGVLRAALNQGFVALDAPIATGDEIAFFPPVTGG